MPIQIPEHILWKLYAPYVVRRLVRARGLSESAAANAVENRSTLARTALQDELQASVEIPVWLCQREEHGTEA